MVRLFVNKLLNILSFIKTYPSGMEEKLSLITYTSKRFHWINSQKGIGLTSTNLSNTHFIGKRFIRTMSTSSEVEPVLIYTNPDGHKGLITKQNKGKSGVYRWVHKDSGKTYVGSSFIHFIALARPFSTLNKEDIKNHSSEKLIPAVIYQDASTDKSIILKDNKNKPGIYRWVNKVNGNCYVGSSINLTDRFRKYYSFSNISLKLLKSKSLIYNAILKYGLKNFKVEIVEYCPAENVINREQYYIDLLRPEYNILTTAGSRLGYLHSEGARLKMSNSSKGRKVSEETKKLLSLAKKGMNNPNYGKTHSKETRALITLAKLGKSFLSESMKTKMSINSGTPLSVIDLKTNETSMYSSITKAAKAIGVSQAAISIRLKNMARDPFIIKKRYKVEIVEKSNS